MHSPQADVHFDKMAMSMTRVNEILLWILETAQVKAGFIFGFLDAGNGWNLTGIVKSRRLI